MRSGAPALLWGIDIGIDRCVRTHYCSSQASPEKREEFAQSSEETEDWDTPILEAFSVCFKEKIAKIEF